ncbi:hypothetical protein [Paraglaciecola chathamensis]|uniref:Uncharacterized protein n=1 Tax=Paraglaciecola agarilytica NO2 TaxID=1125747 RepID=A0ABQ0I435_9ALTE|nr:hypothetical protein [Paraglaciecola chathamensis]GAC04087.1 hypothetical protein GAGA_1229 [Paraglaciecola agarilytica NO2]
MAKWIRLADMLVSDDRQLLKAGSTTQYKSSVQITPQVASQ